VITANLIFLIMGKTVAPEAFQAWGWRIPFLLSILLVALSMYVQLALEDTAEFKALAKAEDKAARKKTVSPVLSVIAKNPKQILLCAGSFVAANGTFYIIITYAVSYWTGQLHLPKTTILWAVMLGSLISAPVLPITAALSDRFGRRGVFLTGAVLELLWAAPFFLLLNTGQFAAAVLAMAGGLVFNGVMYGLQAAMMTEMFSTEFRYSGASLGYQLGAICAGGFAPVIATALLARYHSSMAIAAYMAALCAISFLSVLVLSETHKRENRKPARVKPA
jgi:MFS family permease